MIVELNPGTRLRTKFGKEMVILKRLGDGSQGVVYSVGYDGKKMALKWYRPDVFANRDMFIENLSRNIRSGAPTEEFLWPVDMTGIVEGSFGYVMPLRPDGFVEAGDLFLTPGLFPSFKRAIDACLGIVKAFRVLHNKGYCYQDVSGGNFFVEPQTGRVLICDNDNVAPAGTDTGIRGTPRFMAPEVVVENAVPSMQSDRHSMSVLIFFLLLVQHPLEGIRVTRNPVLDGDAQTRLYGTDPLFVMDPHDRSNAPDPNYPNVFKVWPFLPDHMRAFFERAFSHEALMNPARRPSEVDWIAELTRLRSEVVQCSCGNEVFMQDATPTTCDNNTCRQRVMAPFRAQLSGYSLPVVNDMRIYRCQTGICNADAALDPMAWVLQARGNPRILGIRNIAREPWAATAGGVTVNVAPGQTVQVQDGMSVSIGDEVISVLRNA